MLRAIVAAIALSFASDANADAAFCSALKRVVDARLQFERLVGPALPYPGRFSATVAIPGAKLCSTRGQPRLDGVYSCEFSVKARLPQATAPGRFQIEAVDRYRSMIDGCLNSSPSELEALELENGDIEARFRYANGLALRYEFNVRRETQKLVVSLTEPAEERALAALRGGDFCPAAKQVVVHGRTNFEAIASNSASPSGRESQLRLAGAARCHVTGGSTPIYRCDYPEAETVRATLRTAIEQCFQIKPKHSSVVTSSYPNDFEILRSQRDRTNIIVLMYAPARR